MERILNLLARVVHDKVNTAVDQSIDIPRVCLVELLVDLEAICNRGLAASRRLGDAKEYDVFGVVAREAVLVVRPDGFVWRAFVGCRDGGRVETA